MKVQEAATPSTLPESASDQKAQPKDPAFTRTVNDNAPVPSEIGLSDTADLKPTPVDPLLMGRQVYDTYRCATCHKLGGEGRRFGSPLDNLKTRYDADKLAAFIQRPPYRSMPRFAGTEAELKSLVEFLLK